MVRMTNKLVPLLAAALLTIGAASASAQETAAENTLGQAGQIAIQSDFQISFSRTTVSAAEGEDPESSTTIVLGPALDFFVARNVSIGAQVLFARLSSDDFSITTVGVAPRLGYFVPLGPRLGLWPAVSVAYERSSTDLGDDFDSVSGYDIQLGVRAPLLFQPTDHFFVGIGPVFATQLVSKVDDEDSDKLTSFGLASTVGGHW
jgi:hypothetical protein